MAVTEKTKKYPPSIFMTDEKRHPDPFPIIEKLPPGTGVIFRHYLVANRAEMAQTISLICKQNRLPLFIGADANLAKAVKAAGVHFPKWAFAEGVALPEMNPDWLVLTSVHDLDALKRAEKIGADALLLAPVFPTLSHPEKSALGIGGFTELATATRLPVYALGGITEKNRKGIPSLKNLAGFAGISVFEN